MNCNLFFTSSRACLFISRVTGGADEDCGCLAWQRAAAKRWQESSFNTVLFLPGMAKKITKRPGLCWRALKTDQLCSLKIDQGWKPGALAPGVFGL